MSQLEIGSGTFSAADKKCPVGVSIRIVSSKSEPVAKWTLNWGDGKKESFDAFGYVCKAYHVYDKAKRYDLTLTTLDAEGVSTTYENIGYCVAKAPEASGAELDLDELFADADFVDELFA